MTGAGDLFSSPQPVMETQSTLSLLGALRGLPAEVRRRPWRRPGFPHPLAAKLMLALWVRLTRAHERVGIRRSCCCRFFFLKGSATRYTVNTSSFSIYLPGRRININDIAGGASLMRAGRL